MKHILFFALLFCSAEIFSQTFIKGKAVDSTQNPVPFITVALLNAKDSSVAKGIITDENGVFLFEKINPGSYKLRFKNPGYTVTFSSEIAVDSVSQINLEPFVLKADGVNLKEVSVAVFKPNLEFKKGTMVMNVENSIMAQGNMVIDLLKRMPGVMVDSRNNITINGKSGVRFLFDGRLQQIPNEQMMNLLANMPADAVSTIELITNPPARYDAAGSAGLINIVTKKVKVKGFSGSLSGSTSKGTLWRRGSTLSLNFKSNKLSVYSNTSGFFYKNETHNYLIRRVSDSTNDYTTLSQAYQTPTQLISGFNAGADYEINKKNSVGMNITYNPVQINNWEDGVNVTTADNVFNYDYYRFKINTNNHINSPALNINAIHKFDTTGTQLQFSGDFTNFLEDFSKYNENHFYNSADQEIIPLTKYKTSYHNDFKIYTQKLDFNKDLKKAGISLETGLKSSIANNFNKTLIELSNPVNQQLEVDTGFSNRYHYYERIFAGYATVSKSVKKWEFTAGARAEQTIINADTKPKSFRLKRNYFNVFPSGSVTYKLNTKNSFMVNYSYRLDRPNYSSLNPTRNFNEPLNYGSGNPNLKPQYIHHLFATYNYNNSVTSAVSYLKVKDYIYYYFYGDEKTKVNVDTLANFKDRDEWAVWVSAHKQIKWFSYQVYAVALIRSFTGQLNGIDANSYTTLYYTNFNLEFMLPKDFKMQLNGMWQSKIHDGVQTFLPAGYMDLTVGKSFFNKKLDVSVSLYDVLYSQKFPFVNSLGNQYSYYTERNDSRRLRLFVVWKFGKMKINQSTRRSNDDEKGRLKNVG